MKHLLGLALWACAFTALGATASQEWVRSAAKGEPAARVEAVRKLDALWDEDVARQLLGLLKSGEDGDVMAAIAEAAGRHHDEGATAILKKAMGFKSQREGEAWQAKAAAAKALLVRNAPGDVELAMTITAEKDDRALQRLCEGLSTVPGNAAHEILKSCLIHTDWRVRSAAAEALGKRKDDPKAAPLLVDRLRKEEGRLLDDIRNALTALVGKDHGLTPAAWHAALRAGRDTEAAARMPEAEEAFTHAGTVTYHEVTTHSKRVIFVLDCSHSMKKDDRIGKEKAKMLETLKGLDKGTWFNILTFSEDVACWKENLVPATEANRQDACTYIEKLPLGSSTNTWAALKTALDMARGAGIPSRKVTKESVAEAPADEEDEVPGYGKPGADTIFLMSDGSPWLDGKPQDWNGIADRVREHNRTKRVVIHTIGIGEAQPAFMKRLAEESGGTYVGLP